MEQYPGIKGTSEFLVAPTMLSGLKLKILNENMVLNDGLIIIIITLFNEC